MALQIRRAQLVPFRSLPDEFIDGLLRRLVDSHPRHVAALGQSATRDRIERTIELGCGFGLESPDALEELVTLTVEFGEAFSESPDQAIALEILEHPKLPPALKLDVLREHLRARTRGRMLVPCAPSTDRP